MTEQSGRISDNVQEQSPAVVPNDGMAPGPSVARRELVSIFAILAGLGLGGRSADAASGETNGASGRSRSVDDRPSIDSEPPNYPGGLPVPIPQTLAIAPLHNGVYPVNLELGFSVAVLNAVEDARIYFQHQRASAPEEATGVRLSQATVAEYGAKYWLGDSASRMKVQVLSGRFMFDAIGTYQVMLKNPDSPMVHIDWIVVGH